MVKVYSIPDCPWCKKVKAYLTSKNVSYTDINVEQDPQGRDSWKAVSSDLTVPVTEINGRVIIGFDKEKFDQYLTL